jgi:hypothetical protein
MTTPTIAPQESDEPTADEFSAAKVLTLAALTHEKLSRYYDSRRNYAGTSFTTLGENPPFVFTPADLLAVTLLSVNVKRLFAIKGVVGV